MKILFISKYLSTSKNDGESRLAALIKLFKKNNFEVSAITSSKSIKNFNLKKIYSKKKINNVDYYFIRENNNYSNFSLSRIWSWFVFEYKVYNFNYNSLKFKPSIIYISSLSLLTILNGIYLKKKFQAKLVFEMRDLWPYFLYTTNKFSKWNPVVIILGLIEKIGIFYSDLVIGLIPNIKKYILFRGFYKKNVFASTFPVETKFFIRKNFFKLNLDKRKFNICYAGNFGFDNHLFAMLDLISEIKNSSFVFHFYGDGSQKKKIVEKYSNLNNVKFYNYIKYTKLHSILCQMDMQIVSFGFGDKYPIFGYELNKLNNYLMASKPILVLGKKENLHKNRGKFIFVEKKDSCIFEKKLNLIKKNYDFFLKIAKLNKNKLLIRNNPNLIFEETVRKLKKI